MTLIELVAAIAILSALCACLFLIFQSTLLARKKVDDYLGTMERATGTMGILSHDLEQIHVYDSRAYLLLNQQEVFGHLTTGIAFPCLTPIRVSEDMREKPGLIEVAYLVGPDPHQDGALAVFRRELPIETDTTATEIRDSTQGLVLLADGLTDFGMEFLASPSPDPNATPPDFVEKWDGGFGVVNMPQAIRIHITAGGVNGQPAMTLQRTVRLPLAKVNDEMLQPLLQQVLTNATSDTAASSASSATSARTPGGTSARTPGGTSGGTSSGTSRGTSAGPNNGASNAGR